MKASTFHGARDLIFAALSAYRNQVEDQHPPCSHAGSCDVMCNMQPYIHAGKGAVTFEHAVIFTCSHIYMQARVQSRLNMQSCLHAGDSAVMCSMQSCLHAGNGAVNFNMQSSYAHRHVHMQAMVQS